MQTARLETLEEVKCLVHEAHLETLEVERPVQVAGKHALTLEKVESPTNSSRAMHLRSWR